MYIYIYIYTHARAKRHISRPSQGPVLIRRPGCSSGLPYITHTHTQLRIHRSAPAITTFEPTPGVSVGLHCALTAGVFAGLPLALVAWIFIMPPFCLCADLY